MLVTAKKALQVERHLEMGISGLVQGDARPSLQAALVLTKPAKTSHAHWSYPLQPKLTEKRKVASSKPYQVEATPVSHLPHSHD